ncbi:MAG: hypothetical protein E7082_08430 [Bacteroidales bacterium]|nr:hypothetical protein [Bacteroidales bacterium]
MLCLTIGLLNFVCGFRWWAVKKQAATSHKLQPAFTIISYLGLFFDGSLSSCNFGLPFSEL